MCIQHGTYKILFLILYIEAPPPGKPATPTTPSARTGTVNPNQAFCTVVRTRMASHSIVMAAEIDCVDPVSQFVPDANAVYVYIFIKGGAMSNAFLSSI